ncbi:E3 SUMO-protein ligase PIAS1 [Orchesella cincta]|uniref:E3 SUMO-protein ligase PIAS1 n=1 Tax=Orchesella cincta TaxID=48709 RepID=A0A1D2NK59_ORCCI|nr:E3 SUMO-protein ligase PIAS1 [Orchesella cincta]
MDSELRSMVMAFRVTELQTLLGFAGKNKTGRKNELQARCLDLVKSRSPQIMLKIKDLYKSIQMSTLGQPLANIGSGAAAFGATTASSLASRSYGSGGYAVDCPKDGNYVRGQFGFQKGITVDGQYRNLPICPDVSMKKLPFFDIIAVLLRPQSLLPQGQSPKQETQHTFCLTPSQAGEISKSRDLQITQGDTMPMSKLVYSTQIQLRFCALDTSEEQDDLFPPNLSVKVNSRPIQLPHPIPSNRPGVEPKRPSRPLNVTNNVKLCPHTSNSVQISWLHDTTRNYAVSMYIVKKLTADELLLRLKNKRIQPADFTRGRIKEITTAEEEDLCAPTSIRVSIACPLGKSRMTWPCRGTTCKHLQCFDANLFLLMNEKKPSFICPVCNKHLKFEDLSIDGYFMDVIKNLSIDSGNEIELYADGTWTPAMKIKKEIEDVAPPPKRIKTSDESTSSMNNTIDVDDDICIVEDVPGDKSMSEKSKKTIEPEIIDLIDSSDEEEETTPMYNSNNNSQEAVKPKETEKVNPDPPEEEDDDDDDDEEVGIRPRRRKPRINYVEDSSSDSTSTNEGVVEPSSPSKARSPACIELSDSPTPSPPDQRRQNYEQQRTTSRAFQSVSNQSSASRAASSVNNSRSGSGSSTTLYSSSGSGMPTNPVGHGGPTMTHPNVQQPDYFSRSSSVSMSTSSPAIISPPPSSLLYPPSHAHGYSYDGMSGWEDLSYMNPANFAQVNLNFDYLNSTHGYTPGPGGGGGYPWM